MTLHGTMEKDGSITVSGGGRSKYGSKKTLYNGVVYDSKKEAAYAEELDMRVRVKDIRSWERQVKIPIVVGGEKICDYIMDFVVYGPGDPEYVEVKGFEKPEWKLKWKLLKALYPGMKLTLIK